MGFLPKKRRIATAALAHLPTTGSVLIDAGSTTLCLAEAFPSDRALLVFTNTLPIALALVSRPQLTVFTLGGRVRSRTLAEVDAAAIRTLSELTVDVAFLGANGISLEQGLTSPDPAEAGIKRLMLAHARRRILLADSSKFGRVSLCQYGGLPDIDLLITDTDLPIEHLAALQTAGVTVEQA